MKRATRNWILAAGILMIGLFTACNSNQGPEADNTDPNSHKVVVREVLQVTQYTYMLVSENGKESWIAVPKMEAREGDTYYYINGMLMTNFTSKDLGRTFDSILFIEKLSSVPITQQNQANPASPEPAMPAQDPTQAGPATAQKPVIEKVDVKVSPASGGITIAQLFSKKDSYENKTVKIKGQVTKVNMGIMGKNWVHIQDGTSFENNFDLTVTTGGEFKPGDVLTFEGKIGLKRDFGYGYFYEVIMEDAVAK